MPKFLIENRKTGQLSQIEANNRRAVRWTIEQSSLGKVGDCRIEIIKNDTQVKRAEDRRAIEQKAERLRQTSKKSKVRQRNGKKTAKK